MVVHKRRGLSALPLGLGGVVSLPPTNGRFAMRLMQVLGHRTHTAARVSGSESPPTGVGKLTPGQSFGPLLRTGQSGGVCAIVTSRESPPLRRQSATLTPAEATMIRPKT